MSEKKRLSTKWVLIKSEDGLLGLAKAITILVNGKEGYYRKILVKQICPYDKIQCGISCPQFETRHNDSDEGLLLVRHCGAGSHQEVEISHEAWDLIKFKTEKEEQ